MKTSGIYFCSSSDYFSLVTYYTIINFPPNTLNVQIAKNHKENPFCITESFVTDAVLVSRGVKSQKFNMLYLKKKTDVTGLETCEKIYF